MTDYLTANAFWLALAAACFVLAALLDQWEAERRRRKNTRRRQR